MAAKIMRVGEYRAIVCRGCRRLRAAAFPSRVCYHCLDNRRQLASGGCTALLHHGPGHQSSTYCCVPPAEHSKVNGRIVHMAYYSNGAMEWHGRHGCTGCFDDPCEDPKEGERFEGASGALFSSRARAEASLGRGEVRS